MERNKHMLRYSEIFVPGGFPKYTYNPRVKLGLEDQLKEVKHNLCKLVTVTGQTKSGKTVLVQNVLPREESVWIDGGSIGTEEDFWQIIVEALELFQVTSSSEGATRASEVSGKGSASANFIVAKGTGEIGGKIADSKTSTYDNTRTLSSKIAALEGLRITKTPLVIDDFHYLSREIQGKVVRALKPLVFAGVPVVIIAIPHRRYDTVKVEREMSGRLYPIQIPPWQDEELAYIPREGFRILDAAIENRIINILTHESIGSPHLIQDFCKSICKNNRIEFSGARVSLTINEMEMNECFHDVAESIGRPIFEKLARGPRQRADRIPRELKNGLTVDIYRLILHALADLKPGLVTLEYEDLRSSIRNIIASTPPQLQEVARVLRYMSAIAASDESSTPVIDFEEEEKKLHITDPFFAFFLRWGDINH